MSKKKEVGKGIRALLSNIEKTNITEEKVSSIKKLNEHAALVPLENIETNPFQPRQEFDSEELMELAKSIKTFGLIQPVTLRSMGDGRFQLIAGERRLRASKMAGMHEIPAYIRVANDQEMLEMALVENIQRSNLNALEVAISYQRLMDECELTHDALSKRIGKNRSTITNYVRLLKLPPNIQAAIKDERLSMGHARSIAGIENPVLQQKVFNEVVAKSLSVRATEQLIKSYQKSSQQAAGRVSQGIAQDLPSEVIDIRDRISDMVGTKVEIKRNNKGKGQIVIKFKSDIEFNNIIDRLELD
ncbi:MAG: ParB/RepB/Spo0J family partition protein [Saprospiraceae bacterium]|nr:ParB/RepB/Spo0J family partition protein [Saprospiraceae bacterium]